MTFHVPEHHRVKTGALRTTRDHGNNGFFFVPMLSKKITLRVVASDGLGWEHVSVSLHDRCPTWDEMCYVKALFWDGEDCVVQYHPAESDYVNMHPYTLHLWRPIGLELPRPDPIMVGVNL